MAGPVLLFNYRLEENSSALEEKSLRVVLLGELEDRNGVDGLDLDLVLFEVAGELRVLALLMDKTRVVRRFGQNDFGEVLHP